MSSRLHRCVECPKCHTRYVMGFDPYGNGSHIVSDAAGGTDLRLLFCTCSVPEYHEFKLSELKAYAVPHDAYVRGYGSADQIVLPGQERKQAS
jgi:hypothetical protein